MAFAQLLCRHLIFFIHSVDDTTGALGRFSSTSNPYFGPHSSVLVTMHSNDQELIRPEHRAESFLQMSWRFKGLGLWLWYSAQTLKCRQYTLGIIFTCPYLWTSASPLLHHFHRVSNQEKILLKSYELDILCRQEMHFIMKVEYDSEKKTKSNDKMLHL